MRSDGLFMCKQTGHCCSGAIFWKKCPSELQQLWLTHAFLWEQQTFTTFWQRVYLEGDPCSSNIYMGISAQRLTNTPPNQFLIVTLAPKRADAGEKRSGAGDQRGIDLVWCCCSPAEQSLLPLCLSDADVKAEALLRTKELQHSPHQIAPWGTNTEFVQSELKIGFVFPSLLVFLGTLVWNW